MEPEDAPTQGLDKPVFFLLRINLEFGWLAWRDLAPGVWIEESKPHAEDFRRGGRAVVDHLNRYIPN